MLATDSVVCELEWDLNSTATGSTYGDSKTETARKTLELARLQFRDAIHRRQGLETKSGNLIGGRAV
jgi:hypothetical protein